MKILLDECMPRKFKRLLPGHQCRTVSEAGYAGLENGDLIKRAESDGYSVLITVDRGLQYQQNLHGAKISVLVLYSKSSTLGGLAPLAPSCTQALLSLKPGQIRQIGE
jgi:predicted nuclease of predicted toxin-antitoxin system